MPVYDNHVKSETILVSSALELNTPSKDIGDNTASVFKSVRHGFRVGKINLLIKEGIVSEVIDHLLPYRLPHLPKWMLGLLNIRGDMIPLFDLNILLGESNDKKAKRKIQKYGLILGQRHEAIAIVLESFPIVISQQWEKISKPNLDERLQPYVSQAYLADDEVWFEFDYEELFFNLVKS